ncbi:MAG: hypothetical protein AMXMBFR84_43450 [Candidatus Hydrogenedentota bacterium]
MRILGLVLAAALVTAGEVNTFFDDFAKKREGVKAVYARFTQENTTPDEILVSEGELIYTEPRRILFRYFDPEVTYLVDGDRIYEYDADLEQLQIYDVQDQPAIEAMFLGLDKDTSRLREAFDVELYKPLENECGTQGLMLVPKPAPEDDESAPLFDKARINLQDPQWLPCYVRVDNDEESYFEIKLSDFKYNNDVDLKRAFITLPEGTRIIENEQLVEKVGAGGKIVPESKPEDADLTVTVPSE